MKSSLRINLAACLSLLGAGKGFAQGVSDKKPAFNQEWSEPQKVDLRVGESREFSFEASASLKVSRKGVVNLFHQGEGRWQITGLRKGLVMVESQDRSKTQLTRALITVTEDQAPSAGSVFPQWICDAKAISCDQDLRLIRGQVPSLDWWIDAATFCRQLPGCQLLVERSQGQRREWLQRLAQRLGDEFEIQGEGDQTKVIGLCSGRDFAQLEQYVNRQTDQAVQKGLLVVSCKEEHYKGLFQVNIELIGVKDSESQQTGFRGQQALTMQTQLASPGHSAATVDGMFSSQLDHLIQSNRAKVVAQPMVRVMSGTPTQVISGSEFAFKKFASTGNPSSSRDDQGAVVEWKSVGLDLLVEVIPYGNSMVGFKYESSLKIHTGPNAVVKQALKGTLPLKLGEKVLIGQVDLDQETSVDDASLLSKVPLIGIFFRSSRQEQGKSTVYLWVSVTKLAAN